MVADHQAAIGNAAQIEFWNSAATRAWADQYARMDRAVAGLTKELLDLAAPQPGEHVLDIGCGPGATVLELARRVDPGGQARRCGRGLCAEVGDGLRKEAAYRGGVRASTSPAKEASTSPAK